MKSKYIVPILILVLISVLLAGCINKITSTNGTVNGNILNSTRQNVITIKYIENNGQIIPKDSDFKLIKRQILVAPKNLSNSIETESSHGGLILDSNDKLPEGFRIYGISESYNSSKGYALVQYKIFDSDSNNDLNNSIDLTTNQYVQNGFRTKVVNINKSIKFNGRVIILEANNTANVTNVPNNMNVDIILFGSGTSIGKIGVEDYKDKSINESLNIFDALNNRINIKTEENIAQDLTKLY